jgi:hypothetical protein
MKAISNSKITTMSHGAIATNGYRYLPFSPKKKLKKRSFFYCYANN